MHTAQRDHLLFRFDRRAIDCSLGRKRLTNTRLTNIIALLLLTLLGCVGCGSGESNIVADEDIERPLQLQLNWLPDAQHGGFFAAKTEGHFESEGLDIEIVPGGPGTAVIQKVAIGRCDFAIANADQVLLAREQGADVVAVFAAMQNSPRCIMVHESSGIESLDQLTNVTLALGDGKAFAEYLKREIPLTDVRIVSYSGTVAKFLIDEKFAQQGYVFSEPIMAKQQGGDPKALMVSELGFNPYSSVLITRRDVYVNETELVAKVVRAVRKGWRSYLESPVSANAEIGRVNSEMKSEMLTESAAAIKTLCMPTSETQLGAMTKERWGRLREQLIEIGLLTEASGPAEQAFVSVE